MISPEARPAAFPAGKTGAISRVKRLFFLSCCSGNIVAAGSVLYFVRAKRVPKKDSRILMKREDGMPGTGAGGARPACP